MSHKEKRAKRFLKEKAHRDKKGRTERVFEKEEAKKFQREKKYRLNSWKNVNKTSRKNKKCV